MNKTLKIYIVFLVLLIVAIAFLNSKAPKPIDWSPTYSINDKIPLGLYVLNNEIKTMVKDCKIEKISETPFEFLDKNYIYEDTTQNSYKVKGTYFIIDEFSRIDDQSTKELLNFVGAGNAVFMSTKDFPRILLDTLQLNVASEFSAKGDIKNKVLNHKEYSLSEGASNSYFDKMNDTITQVLGTVKQDTARPNFVKVQFQNGTFFLHNQPAAFTNFHLLKKDHYQYAEQVLSYLPAGNIYWHIKDQEGSQISASPLRYILSQPALKWAWWLFLLGVLTFMLFNAKRKQRIVPIIKPLPNTTVEFIKTIGNLYLQEGDHNNVINKKIIYFLERIRNEFLIDTSILDEKFILKLHQKTGKSKEDIERVVYLIKTLKGNTTKKTESDLIQITNAIETILQ